MIQNFKSDFLEMLKGISSTIRNADTSPAIICSIMSGYLWAFSLALPGETMNPERPVYGLMSSLLSEVQWVLLFFTLASVQLWRFYSVISKRTFKYELIIKFASCAVWTFVSLSCVASRYPPAAAVMDTVIVMVAAWWDFLRFDKHKIDKSAGE